jgi:predicted molibdopterin-dependent oxidoreductase YjgC
MGAGAGRRSETDMGQTLTTCTFCGVGCGIYLEAANDRVTGAYPSLSHPTNRGRICVRGWHVHEVASSPERLRSPLLRRGGRLVEATWDEALGYIVGRIKEIRARYGPDALAFFNMPRCSNEESYLLQKLARAVMGTNNVDHGSGPYCNNSINVLRDMLGVSATTNSIGELFRSDAIVVDGVDLGMQLPTIGGIVIRAKLDGAKLIVIDPRRHLLAEHADYFLQVRPGTEALVYAAMAKVIVDRGLMNQSFVKTHCRDYDAFVAAVGRLDLLGAAEASGVAPELIEGAALAYGRARAAAWLYSTGVEARNEDSIRSAVNLVLLTGNVGRPGAGVYALTEHNNLQGVCDMGVSPQWLPGYRDVADATARRTFEQAWDTPLPAQPGLGARDMFENGKGSTVKALWLSRYDPVTSAASNNVADVLARMELVVVQHLFPVAAAEQAHVVLPVVAYGEEEVSFTSTDRRIQLARQVLPSPDGPMPVWRQLMFLARSLGAGWAYESSARVMDEISRVVPDYSGVSHENLGRDYGRQWPCTKDRPLGTPYLFDTGIPGRCFRFRAVAPPAEVALQPAGYPFALIFGHSLYYWHQNVLVKHSETLRRELRVLLLDYPEGFVEISDEDAAALKIRDGGRIRLVAEKGTALTTARVAREVRSGTIYVPFFVREVARDLTGRARSGLGDLDEPVFVRLERVDSQ